MPGHPIRSNYQDQVEAKGDSDSTLDEGQVVGAMVIGGSLEDRIMPILEVCGDELCPLLGHLSLETGVELVHLPGVIPCLIYLLAD